MVKKNAADEKTEKISEGDSESLRKNLIQNGVTLNGKQYEIRCIYKPSVSKFNGKATLTGDSKANIENQNHQMTPKKQYLN